MLWLKAFHIIAVVCWFAGIFYLPRILVYYAKSEHLETRTQLAVMAGKLYRFVTPIAVIALGLGVALVWQNPGYYLAAAWLQLKLVGVLALIIYHVVCGVYVARVARGECEKTHVFYRVFNEVPVIFLVMIVILAVVRPW
ncbi:MAG: putative membrane protein [Halieaceae bacterium]